MKYHESQFDEYLARASDFDLHPELRAFEDSMPPESAEFRNILIYGSSGVGKYTQMLRFIKKYSPSGLKYDKKMDLQTEKYEHSYRISDIHYEIDMSLLGCNSKLVWHDIYMQIVDIVSLKACKNGIIVCKNFHAIHSELLENFYSYIQQYSSDKCAFQIKFIILSEHISFLPNNILQNMQLVHVKRPSKELYMRMGLPQEIETEYVLNLKEIHTIQDAPNLSELPQETFDNVCETLVEKINEPDKMNITEFRDFLYDILVYNLDIYDVLWYVITHFIRQGKLSNTSLVDILNKSYQQLQQYNNNYRPIYHLESIFITILNHIHNYSFDNVEPPKKIRKSASNTRIKSGR
jgi:hypothetical protein